jgi:hypothetical protein
MPLAGMLLAAALIVSLRPDAVTNAQFWAEDGKFFYADVYNRGLLPTLMVPQAGISRSCQSWLQGLRGSCPSLRRRSSRTSSRS